MFGRRKRLRDLERQVRAQQAEIEALREQVGDQARPRTTKVELEVRKRDAFWVSFWAGFLGGWRR